MIASDDSIMRKMGRLVSRRGAIARRSATRAETTIRDGDSAGGHPAMIFSASI